MDFWDTRQHPLDESPFIIARSTITNKWERERSIRKRKRITEWSCSESRNKCGLSKTKTKNKKNSVLGSLEHGDWRSGVVDYVYMRYYSLLQVKTSYTSDTVHLVSHRRRVKVVFHAGRTRFSQIMAGFLLPQRTALSHDHLTRYQRTAARAELRDGTMETVMACRLERVTMPRL